MSPAATLTCGVIIPTHNRREVLAETLAAVSALEPPPDEVLVCADGCRDDTVAWVRANYPGVRLLVNEAAGGQIAARNRMGREASADILLSLDDDSFPLDRDAVARIRDVFAARPGLGCADFALRSDEFPETLTAADFGPVRWVGTWGAGAGAYRREAFLRVGGLDPGLRKAYDEPDFALRLIAAGYDVQYRPEIVLRHLWSALNRDERRVHANHCTDEQWSLWRRCPWPWVMGVSKWRVLRQGMYAARRGADWLVREPAWWLAFARRWPAALRRREPLPWPLYFRWMRLLGRPVAEDSQWRRAQRAMGVRRVGGGDAPPPASARPRIAFAATNPCHLWDMARELDATGHLGAYYSGYPAWRLRGVEDMRLVTHSARTVAVYAARRFLSEGWRPCDRTLFTWQDEAFDAWAAGRLKPADFVHGLPGQCLETLARARALGARTVLNHASGPWQEQVRLVEEEYRRAGLDVHREAAPDPLQAERRRREMELADYHCAASEIVRRQLMAEGVPAGRIWVVPYGADPALFYRRAVTPEGPARFLFAGACSLRKGPRFLLDALAQMATPGTELHVCGAAMAESEPAFTAYRGAAPVVRHGAVGQAELGRHFRAATALVLPSAEEAFGLVVVQAQSCGLPCIVSDRVGAGDLITHRVNGSIVPFGDAGALAEEMAWWAAHPATVEGDYGWGRPARLLLDASRRAMEGPARG